MYSIVELNNKQYMVEFGKPLLIDRVVADENNEIKLDKVLLYRDDKEVRIGTPYLKGLSLTAKVLGEVKGSKIRVFKYKRRKDYRRTIGSRPHYTRIVVEAPSAEA
jgi:large subunit ribosomal protein L21